jgi:magnesium transporter
MRLLGLRRQLITIRRVLSPERDVLAMLVRRGDPRISEKTALYFRDVYDHLVRTHEQIDMERDLLGNAMEAYISMMENRTNNIMKQLTIFASIFLPLTFLTGFFGQNFEMMPYRSEHLYWTMLAVCAAVPVGMLLWFRWRRWL